MNILAKIQNILEQITNMDNLQVTYYSIRNQYTTFLLSKETTISDFHSNSYWRYCAILELFWDFYGVTKCESMILLKLPAITLK